MDVARVCGSLMLPTTVRVGCYDYNVETMDKSESRRYSADGFCDADSLTIKINCEMPEQTRLETLYHEIMHAVNHVANVTDQTTEEDSVRRTAPVWLSVWRDNPFLLAAVIWYCKKYA